MRKADEELKEAKIEYEKAKRIGNHALEAQWANSIADILKNKGEYVEALRWLRIDHEISVKYLPLKQLLPTCQSMGEIYLRLEQFKHAITYQKKHLELAEDTHNLIEQQRAKTQLGRTYHEMFLKSENDHNALRNAKKYLKSAMKLARTLKDNPPCNTASYCVKEFIDAHNNVGLLEFDLDNMDEAEKVLLQGLKICNDEEVSEYDDARTRLHNSLGRVYMERREWNKARHHIERDISICKQIGHSLGESKGFVNLGEVHFRVQKYDDANRCYQKALDIAEKLEDEKALVDLINNNFETTKEAAKVLQELFKDEQKLKKLMRTALDVRRTSKERKFLLEQYSCLDSLIEKSCMIFAWQKHLEFAKRKKKVASELCDKDKLSDSLLAIGESYQKLRNFNKARKWYMKSWNICRSIGNLEGQATSKINIGSVLDSSGDWPGALQAFEEGYRIAREGNLLSLQKTALENMHYSQMIRFDNLEEARKLLLDLGNLDHLLDDKDVLGNTRHDYCSETETEGGISDNLSNACESPEVSNHALRKPTVLNAEESDGLVPLVKFIRQNKNLSRTKITQLDSNDKQMCNSSHSGHASSGDLHKSINNLQSVGRKRAKVVISDDDTDDPDDMDQMRKRFHGSLTDDVASSDKDARKDEQGTNKDTTRPTFLRDVHSTCAPDQTEGSSCSFKSKSPSASKRAVSGSKLESGSVSGNLLNDHDFAVCHHIEDDDSHYITCKIGHDVVHMNMGSCMDRKNVDTESMKIAAACHYYLKLYDERRSNGLAPMFKHLKYCGKVLDSLEPVEVLKDLREDVQIEAIICGWVPKRLMDLYVGCCEKLSETPNIKLVKKLYSLEVSEDEVIVPDCGLQDTTIFPFINALQAHKTVAVLDISHNFLGNETMEKLQQMFSASTQKYGGLTLDLHCNRFGPTSLFQICECPVLFARLEVLNLSGNRLTDSCSSYLYTILEKCKALYSLNIEQCSITSRTIQKVADALRDDSVLSHLSIGKNTPISGIAMVNLLAKLASLKRFSELSLVGIRLNKAMVDGLCKLASSSNLSELLLGGTYIGMDGAVMLTSALCSGPQDLVKLDLSYCGLSSHDFPKICANVSLVGGLAELNLEGNFIGQEVFDPLRTILMDQQCCLKSLILNKCHLGLIGIIQIIQALSENESLEELHLAENTDIPQDRTLEYETGSPKCLENKMEAADSDDEEPERPKGSSSASSSHRSQLAGSQLVQELGTAIDSAVNLQLLDLSRNKLSSEVIEVFYGSWCLSSTRNCGSAYRHVSMDGGIVHFSMKGKRCCGIKPCCKRD
ncbi:uncharacterized protein A4U43_C08F26980 [Asparagus officinalis]|uniref:protein TONSOKU isoform X2 n=1 Tax=Asparagus officinalis TaxID=4686 RepID=UPI00098E6044|nr:protein TONSOKU isoform X2 [Asparagus officinalis]ONK61173.1 uncharacterized protein A4U43_C08F26980 [Asparagus officinalis]